MKLSLTGILALAAAGAPGLPGALAAQDQVGAVTGFVIDAASAAPLANASVVLEASGDATIVKPSGQGAFLSRGSTTVTGLDGGYRFQGLAPGSYRLHVRHLGYREAILEVDLLQGAPFRVSVGLELSPIRLEPIGVESPGGQAFGRMRTALEEARFGRTEAEMLRQVRFLESDARMLTQSEVTEAVTLGEGDLLRALQRLPGVSARDDYTAGLWTRGAAWGQTRAYYDGLPLFNPVHAFGLLSSLNPDAVGVASFHPGVRTAAIGEGAAGVLNMTSRAADRSGVHLLSELSVTSARATVDLRSRNGMQGLVVGARRSYVDAATRLAQLAGGDSATYVPYSFLDLSTRADMRFSDRTALTVSGLWAQDNVHGTLRRILLQETEGRWGNQLAQATLEHQGQRVGSRVSFGVSRFDGVINPPPEAINDSLFSEYEQVAAVNSAFRPTPQPHGSTFNGLTVVRASGEIAPPSGAQRPSWAAGVQVMGYRQSFRGQFPRPYPAEVLPDALFLEEDLVVPALWAEKRWSTSQFALETGLRLEATPDVWNTPPLAIAPRVTLRYTAPHGRATLSASFGRSWQYTQALAPAGPSVGPDLYLTDVWLLSSDTMPAMRADIFTVGGELAFGGGWVGSVTAYARRSTGVAIPDPRPGELNNLRPIFVEGINRARGVEMGVRRIVGRMTASVSYALSRSDVSAALLDFPSPADRRHVVDGTAMFRVTPAVRLGAAATLASGAPFSRFTLATTCDTLANRSSCRSVAADSIGPPMAVRTPVYAALDLLVDWEGRLGSARVGAFLQIRNVLNRSNAVTYLGTSRAVSCAPGPPKFRQAGPGRCDEFDRGIPLLPLAGVRIAF